MEAVRFEGVSYAFGQWQALCALDFTVNAGEYVALVGRNGSGKSTLARHINALLRPDDGHVYTFEMDTRDDALTLSIRSAAGMIFQNPDNQIVASVVEEDVAFGPENLGDTDTRHRQQGGAGALAVDMEAYKLRAPYQLSGGQKQRIAIAGVLAMQPKLIISMNPPPCSIPWGAKPCFW